MTEKLKPSFYKGRDLIDRRLKSLLDQNNYFGPSDWQRYFNIVIPDNIVFYKSFNSLANILEAKCPFYRYKKIRQTHSLLYLPFQIKKEPLTLMTWQEYFNEEFGYNPCIYGDAYRPEEESFIAKSKPSGHWLLMLKGIIPESNYMAYDEQLTLLPKGYRAPKIIEATIFHFLLGEKMGDLHNYSTFGRCSDMSAENYPMHVGYFDGNEVYIGSDTSSVSVSDIGLFATMTIN